VAIRQQAVVLALRDGQRGAVVFVRGGSVGREDREKKRRNEFAFCVVKAEKPSFELTLRVTQFVDSG